MINFRNAYELFTIHIIFGTNKHKMKNAFILFLAIAALSIVASCKKSSSSTTPSVVGYWTGSTGSDGIEFLFRSNNTIRVFLASTDTSLADKYEGTYTVGSDSVRAHWNGVGGFGEKSAAGKLNTAATTMVGTFGDGTSTAGLGIFTITKY